MCKNIVFWGGVENVSFFILGAIWGQFVPNVTAVLAQGNSAKPTTQNKQDTKEQDWHPQRPDKRCQR